MSVLPHVSAIPVGEPPLTAVVPKERPILFSALMVRAILDGSKTQTRRLVTPQPEFLQIYEYKGKLIRDASHRNWCWKGKAHGRYPDEYGPSLAAMSPYGQPGDRLWVKEAHQIFHVGDSTGVAYRATCEPDGSFDAVVGDEVVHIRPERWRPSIHMRRAWSRITLEVIGIRAERLHAITEEDAKAEGATPFFTLYPCIGRDQRLTSGERCDDAEHRAGFACLWDDINADRATWKSNPWVWVVEFRRVQ